MYGIAHCLIDRDGRVIGCNLPIGNGPLLEQAPAMAQIVREHSQAVWVHGLYKTSCIKARAATPRRNESEQDAR
jgi:hypothetical protein